MLPHATLRCAAQVGDQTIKKNEGIIALNQSANRWVCWRFSQR